MLTIGLGLLPALRRRHHLGLRDLHARRRRSAGVLDRSAASCSATTSCRSSSAPSSCARVLYVFFNHTRMGIAMQATSQNQLAAYYMGIPVKRMFSLIWAICAARRGLRRRPAGAGDPHRHQHRPRSALKAFAAAVLGGFGSIPGALVGGIIIGVIERCAGVYLPRGLQGRRRLHRAADRAGGPAAGPVRHADAQEGLSRHAFPVQDRLQPGHPPLPAQRRLVVVRRAGRARC